MNLNKESFYYILTIILLIVYNIIITQATFVKSAPKDEPSVLFQSNYFSSNISLKDYSSTKFKLSDEGKGIIANVRDLHKSASLIHPSNIHKDLCAWYIYILSEKLWSKETPHHIWMINTKTRTPAKAWELPAFYKWFWWDVLIDLSDKFSIDRRDYWEKIELNDIKMFFKNAFSEESLFWDIWFFYKDSKYAWFLRNWSSNTHLAKNFWLSTFNFIVWKDYINKTSVEIIADTLKCTNINNDKLFPLLENYNLSLNWRAMVFKDNELYYLNGNNTIWSHIQLKYLDVISYDDITLSHFIRSSSHVNWLFDMVCSWDFFPINVISINKRMIEKM